MSKTNRPCPMCKKPRSESHTPFCSERCRDRDLAKWFGDSYAVPAEPVNPEEIANRDWDNQE